ncbi:MAG: hypothetical protein AAFV27_07540 [Pseudomonadota bacterium]
MDDFNIWYAILGCWVLVGAYIGIAYFRGKRPANTNRRPRGEHTLRRDEN